MIGKKVTINPQGEVVTLTPVLTSSLKTEVDVATEILYQGSELLNENPSAVPTVHAVFEFMQDIVKTIIEPTIAGDMVVTSTALSSVIETSPGVNSVILKQVLGFPYVDETTNTLKFQ